VIGRLLLIKKTIPKVRKGNRQGGNTPSNNSNTAKSGELLNITDDQIIAYKLNNDGTQTTITGDERSVMIAAIPTVSKYATC
jgi:hypothetical protein